MGICFVRMQHLGAQILNDQLNILVIQTNKDHLQEVQPKSRTGHPAVGGEAVGDRDNVQQIGHGQRDHPELPVV